MAKIQAPRGTADILPADSWKWQAVERIARETARLYHFQEIRTPVFEHTELFFGGVGQATDLVTKETYTFNDRSNRSLSLRPEGTAGVARALIEHNLLAQQGARLKVFYIGPNFRYEKPQAGRLRQHHQFGVEAFGIPEPEQDLECILLQLDFYQRCGLRGLSLRLNSLGDRQSKARYRQALLEHLAPRASKLSPDSQRRLQINPLRILDSKDPRDIDACADAPPAFEYLSENSRTRFRQLQSLLAEANVPFELDGRLVRGLDYYTDTIWEFVASGLGAQNAVGGGGRYDNLIEELGGPPTPGVGFGSGIERLLLALETQGTQLPQDSQPLLWLIAHGQNARQSCIALLRQLRQAGFQADMDYSLRPIKAQFKVADRQKARFCLVLGDDELAANTVTVKDLAASQQSSVPREQLLDYLRKAVASPTAGLANAPVQEAPASSR